MFYSLQASFNVPYKKSVRDTKYFKNTMADATLNITTPGTKKEGKR